MIILIVISFFNGLLELLECDLSGEVSGLWSSTCCEVGRREVFGLRATARSFRQGEASSLARQIRWRGEFAMSSPTKLQHAYSEVASLAKLLFSQNHG